MLPKIVSIPVIQTIFLHTRDTVDHFFVLQVLAVSVTETDGGLLSLDSIEHPHILPLNLLNLLLPEGCIQGSDFMMGSPAVRRFSFIIFGDLLEQQPVLALDFRIFGLKEIMLFRVLIKHSFITNGMMDLLLLLFFPRQLLHFAAMVSHSDGDLIVSKSVLKNGH